MITSSSIVVGGDVTDLAVLDGVTSFMSVNDGSGPSTNVTINYAVPEPAMVLLHTIDLGTLALLHRRAGLSRPPN